MFVPAPTEFIATHDIQLAVERYGSGDKALILLHGLTANRASFYGLLQHGLAEGYHVWVVDLRGRGLSDKPATGYSMADHAADILGLMDAEGLAQAILIGHSFGGLLSMYMAAHHADRIDRIVVMDAGKEATHPDVLPKIRPSLERLGKTVPSWDTYIEAIKASPYYADGFWTDELETYYRTDVETLTNGAVRSRVYAAGIAEAVEKIVADDWASTIRQVTCPALLVHASAPFGPQGAPPVMSEAGARETLALLADAQYVTVSGHHITMLFGDHALQVVQAIQDFI